MSAKENKLVLLGDVSECARHMSPKQSLERMLRDIESGEVKGDKCMLIVWDDDAGDIWRETAGMNLYQIIYLLEKVKNTLIK